jgi:hypothetical protein
MNDRRVSPEAQTAVLLRMAASREALLRANRAPPSAQVGSEQPQAVVASLLASLAGAPRVTLLLALCVGAIVLGPRRTISVAGRSGITAWIGIAARKAFTKGQ